jgi:DNA-binding response OmpR family regulator
MRNTHKTYSSHNQSTNEDYRDFKPMYYDLTVLDYLIHHVNGLEWLKDIDPSSKAPFLTSSYEVLNEHMVAFHNSGLDPFLIYHFRTMPSCCSDSMFAI